MSTTVKTGWLEDTNGEYFAPKTLTSQVQRSDGTLLDDIVASVEESLDAKTIKGTKITNSDAVYVKDVPENSAGYAKIGKIGGKTRKTKNLLNTFNVSNTDQGLTFANSDSNLGLITVNGTKYGTNVVRIKSFSDVILPAGEYTLSAKLISGTYVTTLDRFEGIYVGFNGAEGYSCMVNNASTNITLTEPTAITGLNLFVYTDNGVFTDYIISVQLEAGSTATDYEPYFEGLRSAPVTAIDGVGRNMFGGELLVSTISSIPGVSATVDRSNKTIMYAADQINNKLVFDRFKPNTQYTFVFKGYNTNSESPAANLAVRYTDGSAKNFYFNKEENLVYYVSDEGKSIKDLCGTWHTQFTYLYYDKCGIFEGVITEFSPCIRRTICSIPSAVQALDSYGCSIDDTLYNYIDFEKKQYVRRVGCVEDLGALTWLGAGSGIAYAILPNTLVTKSAKALVSDGIKSDVITSIYFDYGLNAVVFNYNDQYSLSSIPDACSGVTLVYELTPIITDISHLLPSDSIPVEAGGTIIMDNAYGYDVPNTVEFYEGANEIVGADTFVGDLVGTAGRAIADENGNRISSNYAQLINGAAYVKGIKPHAHHSGTSSAGWYRIYTGPSPASGRTSTIFTIGRSWGNAVGEEYTFSIQVVERGWDMQPEICITQLSGTAALRYIQKIRVLSEFNNKYYIDFYFSQNNDNGAIYVFGIGAGEFNGATLVDAAVEDGFKVYEFETVINGIKTNRGISIGSESYGESDLNAGTHGLANGRLYYVYEK